MAKTKKTTATKTVRPRTAAVVTRQAERGGKRVSSPRASARRIRISEKPTLTHWVLKEVLSRKEKARYWRLFRVGRDPIRFPGLDAANRYILAAAKDEIALRKIRYLLVYTKTLPISKRVYVRVDFGGSQTNLTREQYGRQYEETKKKPPALPVETTRPVEEKRPEKPKTAPVAQPRKTRRTVDFAARPSYKNDRAEPAVSFKDLSLSFVDPVTGGRKTVLRNVNLDVYTGQVLGLIGESGSGKTVLTSLLTGILPANAVVDSGKIIINGIDVTDWNSRAWQESKFRGRVVGQVFQNPLTTLNPIMKIGEQLIESLIDNKLVEGAKEAYDQAVGVLSRMKITDPQAVMDLYPHQLSGGMRQRVVIAAILSMRPNVVILDEPTTALDATVQAEILDIVGEIKDQFDATFIYITHDIGVIASIADAIAIMYAGSVVERGTSREILLNARHPYTWGLLLSMPEVNDAERLWSIPGAVPADITNIKGDVFAPRNPYALAVDFVAPAPMYRISRTHYAATRLLDSTCPKYEPPGPIARKWREFNGRNWK